ncbi:unnamed protein product [Mytilus coruscus]|uniref:Leucine-rich repeat-containing protein 28 n=1 Tax=Mytilus coruscus TaxID=42192 RepID=A0A6J8B7C1_MYTCO|nr:unnamed protein product [Mytilus coruscus]
MDVPEQQNQVCNKVCSLQLTYKGLTEVPEYLLTDESYKALNLIYLGRNLISKLPENLGNLSALTGLFVNHNKLQFLPEAIGCLKNLDTLNFTGNELTSLPAAIGNLLKLQKLQMCNNKLSRLPTCIGKLSELRSLEVANNNLITIPVELSHCENLLTLNLDNNRLTFLPRQLRNLVNLTEFSAVANNLYVLPQDIGSKDTLHTLYVDKNERLYTLPSTVLGKEIGFYRCGCEPLSTEILEHFPYVKIQHTLTEKLPILLPPDIQHVCNMEQCVLPLSELAMRKVSTSLPTSDIIDSIPYNLSATLSCPLAKCEMCQDNIFLSGFPIVYKDYVKSAYILGMCCSLQCTKKCFHGTDNGLPVVYPRSEDLSLALVLVQ